MGENPNIERTIEIIQQLMRNVTPSREEQKIYDLIVSLEGPDLEAVLSRLDLDELFGDMDDRLIGPDMRTKLTDLLFERTADLSPETLAAFIHAVQTGPTLLHQERSIRRVLLSLRGKVLASFKALLNARGDYHDLEKLIFDDIDDRGIRQDILDHIAQEAAGSPTNELKILCDIDDTVQARLHDHRFPKRTVYPGVIAFIEELDKGGEPHPGLPGDLTFITARPMDIFGLVENYTRDGLSELGLPAHTVLSGSFLHLLTNDSMANKKIENFNHFRLLFPEAGVVFIGDSGQGDVAVGLRMLQIDAQAVRGVFIHDVRESSENIRDGWRDEGIIVFDTYIGAAIEARARHMISTEGLQRVVDAVQKGFAGISFSSEAQRRHARELLDRDLARIVQS